MRGGRTAGRLGGWALLLLLAAPLRAQDTTAVRDSAALVRDTVSLDSARVRGDSVRPRPPVPPATAFLRSLVLPGWGQSTMHRHLTAGLFVAFEGVAVAMVWKSSWQLEYARVRGKYVNSHRQEQQDWIVLLAFNHLFSAAEALVSAHLYDFPAALKAEALPDGHVFYGVSIPLR